MRNNEGRKYHVISSRADRGNQPCGPERTTTTGCRPCFLHSLWDEHSCHTRTDTHTPAPHTVIALSDQLHDVLVNNIIMVETGITTKTSL